MVYSKFRRGRGTGVVLRYCLVVVASSNSSEMSSSSSSKSSFFWVFSQGWEWNGDKLLLSPSLFSH